MARIVNKSKLTSKSQVTIPKKVREFLGINPGDQVAFKIEGDTVRVVPVVSTLDKNFGALKPVRRPEEFGEVRKDAQAEVARQVAEEQ